MTGRPASPTRHAKADALDPSALRALDRLALELRREVDAAEADFRSAVAHAIRAGELLIAAKAQLRHGEWLPWLEANFPGGRSTAANYMRMARKCADVAHLPTVREAVALLAAPKPPEPEPLTAAERADLAKQEAIIHAGLADLRALSASGQRDGVHTALGYGSWQEFVDAEFPPGMFARDVTGLPPQDAALIYGLLKDALLYDAESQPTP